MRLLCEAPSQGAMLWAPCEERSRVSAQACVGVPSAREKARKSGPFHGMLCTPSAHEGAREVEPMLPLRRLRVGSLRHPQAFF